MEVGDGLNAINKLDSGNNLLVPRFKKSSNAAVETF